MLETISRIASILSCLIAIATIAINQHRWLFEKLTRARTAAGKTMIRWGTRLLDQKASR